MIFVWLALTGVAVWELASGWRSGTMSALGQVYATADVRKQPVRFWFFGGFNVVLVLAGVALAADELLS